MREALCIQLAISLSRSTFPFPLLSSLRGAPFYQSAILGATLNKIIASKIVSRVAHVALCYQQVAAHSSIPVPFSLAILRVKHSGGALRRLEPSGAAGWVGWCCTGRPEWRHGFFSIVKHSGGALRRLEPSGAAGWVGWCCTGRPEIGTAFRRIRPPIAQQSRADRPLTGAANECRLKGGTRKHHPTHHHAERKKW